MKIAIVGDIGLDYYKNLDLLKPGGIGFNVACNLVQDRQVRVSLVSALGNDIYSKKLFQILKSLNIGIDRIQNLKGDTPIQNILLRDGERKFVGYKPGILKKWKLNKEDIQFLEKQDAIFVPLSDGMDQIFYSVKSLSSPVKVVDFSQDYEFADFDKKKNVISKFSKFFDIIYVGGRGKDKKLIRSTAKRYPNKLFVLTLGAKGVVAFTDGKEYVQKAQKVDVIDTTGAGDSFQAVFLSNYLKTKDVSKSLKAGIIQATETIKQVGSTKLKLK